MSDIAIKVESLDKKYRIGLKKEKYKTISGEISNFIKSPLNNFKRLRSLKKFDDQESDDVLWALRDVSFEIKRGEAVGIIGRNGAGKSTLLKVLSRITEPTNGKIIIHGRVASLLEVGTGFNPELTGRENIFLNGTILGMTRREIERKLDEIIDFSGVEKFIDTPVKRYSSGMYVRLAFAVAAHLEPEILVIDEVLAVGDAEFQKKCLGKMDEVAKRGRTVLFVSHNLNAIEQLCTHSLVFNKGTLCFSGKTEDAINYYNNTIFKYNNTETITNYSLNKNVKIDWFEIEPNKINCFGSITYKLSITSNVINKIGAIAILFYNQLNERIAIIDIRSSELLKISETKETVIINGTINQIPFIESNLYVGLYINSVLCTGDFLGLKMLQICNQQNDDSIIQYTPNVRGIVNLNNQWNIK